ncbi:MAG: hypothetical protein WAZ27_02235 [Minisyncoccia bacterium]
MTKKNPTEFDELHAKLDRVIDAMATKDDITRLEGRIERLEQKSEERFHQVMSSIDALTKAVSDLKLEYAVVIEQLKRHEEWIRLIAKKAGVELPASL